MWSHSLLSGVLLMLPIVVTVGVYIGVEFQRIFHGGFGGYGVPTDFSNQTRVVTNRYCQKAFGITPSPGRYTYNPNQWGLAAEEASGLCMNITTSNNQPPTYRPAAPFTATWQYSQGPTSEPVHAFPNALLEGNGTLPLLLSDMAGLRLDVSWTYNSGNSAFNSTDSSSLDTAGMNANVCVDMFLAADEASSGITTKAKYEVMVWLGRYGSSTQPIGLLQGSKDNFNINGTRFDLYFGTNGINQEVYTWVAERNVTRFVGDISPLVTRLSTNGGPTSTDHLGYVAFGSEALYSFNNVTFYVPELDIDLTTQ